MSHFPVSSVCNFFCPNKRLLKNTFKIKKDFKTIFLKKSHLNFLFQQNASQIPEVLTIINCINFRFLLYDFSYNYFSKVITLSIFYIPFKTDLPLAIVKL